MEHVETPAEEHGLHIGPHMCVHSSMMGTYRLMYAYTYIQMHLCTYVHECTHRYKHKHVQNKHTY